MLRLAGNLDKNLDRMMLGWDDWKGLEPVVVVAAVLEVAEEAIEESKGC